MSTEELNNLLPNYEALRARAMDASARIKFRGKGRTPSELRQIALFEDSVDSGNVGQVKSLIEAGVSPNDHIHDNCHLTRAVFRGNNELIRILLSAGANPNPDTGCPPLLQATSQSNFEAVQLLLVAGADPNHSPPDGESALLHAALRGNHKIITTLLMHKAKTEVAGTVCVKNRRFVAKVTPLMAAAWAGKSTVVKQLLGAGANVAAIDSEGCNALDWSARCTAKMARHTITEYLLKAGAIGRSTLDKPFIEATDFRAAAKDGGYRKVVDEIARITGSKPRQLEGADDSVRGGYAFVMDLAKAKALVNELQSRFLSAGAFVFYTHDQGAIPGGALAVLPTSEALEAVAAMETAGPNQNVDTEQIVDWLKNLAKEQDFRLLGVGPDFVEVCLSQAVKNPAKLARSIATLCSEAETTKENLTAQARQIEQAGRFILWWD